MCATINTFCLASGRQLTGLCKGRAAIKTKEVKYCWFPCPYANFLFHVLFAHAFFSNSRINCANCAAGERRRSRSPPHMAHGNIWQQPMFVAVPLIPSLQRSEERGRLQRRRKADLTRPPHLTTQGFFFSTMPNDRFPTRVQLPLPLTVRMCVKTR